MAESYISSTSSVGPQQAVIGKNVSERVSVVNGQRQTIRTEEIIKADGTKEVTETVIDGGEIRKNKYSLAPGEYRAIGHYWLYLVLRILVNFSFYFHFRNGERLQKRTSQTRLYWYIQFESKEVSKQR